MAVSGLNGEWLAIYLPSMLVSSSVMDRASSGSPVMWAMLRRRVDQFGLEIEFQQAEHLRVAILLDDDKRARAAR